MASGKDLKPNERLIVAADFKPSLGYKYSVVKETEALASCLFSLKMGIKVNSVLRFRGYELIANLHLRLSKVFADLKLNDIPETMATDAEILSFYEPDFLTVMCAAGVEGMKAVKEKINPSCLVLGVTVLTSLKASTCIDIFGRSPEKVVLSFAEKALEAGLDGLVLSPLETAMVRKEFGNSLLIVNPGIRPAGANVKNDDQSRIATPGGAIKNGADMLVVGRPITQAENPLEAAKKIIKEIEDSLIM